MRGDRVGATGVCPAALPSSAAANDANTHSRTRTLRYTRGLVTQPRGVTRHHRCYSLMCGRLTREVEHDTIPFIACFHLSRRLATKLDAHDHATRGKRDCGGAWLTESVRRRGEVSLCLFFSKSGCQWSSSLIIARPLNDELLLFDVVASRKVYF